MVVGWTPLAIDCKSRTSHQARKIKWFPYGNLGLWVNVHIRLEESDWEWMLWFTKPIDYVDIKQAKHPCHNYMYFDAETKESMRNHTFRFRFDMPNSFTSCAIYWLKLNSSCFVHSIQWSVLSGQRSPFCSFQSRLENGIFFFC